MFFFWKRNLFCFFWQDISAKSCAEPLKKKQHTVYQKRTNFFIFPSFLS
jgi:hypothetical protein